MYDSYTDYLYRKSTIITFNKNDIEVNFTEFKYSNIAKIPIHCTSLGEHKIESLGFNSYPDCAIYVKYDLWSIPHSLIVLKSELYNYGIDTKLLYSLYLKNRMEFDSISLVFCSSNNRDITAYIDTLKVKYIKP